MQEAICVANKILSDSLFLEVISIGQERAAARYGGTKAADVR